MHVVLEALAQSRTGDLVGAIETLRAARARGPLPEQGLSLLYTLLLDRGCTDESFDLCGEALTLAKTPLVRSTWHLRRGLLHVEMKNRALALGDLQQVLRLKASEDHVEQAQRALLVVAGMRNDVVAPSRKRP